MKNWADYLDEKGLVVQKKDATGFGDGGDSLNRSSVTVFLSRLSGPTPLLDCHDVDLILGNGDGRFRRSWHPDKWYNNFDRTSRDQLTPLVIMGGNLNMRPMLKQIFFNHLKRGLLFAYNTRRNFMYPTLEEHQRLSTPDVAWDYSWKVPDFTGPEFWALYIRGFECKLLYPLLYLFDIHTALGALVLRYQKEVDVINHAVVLEYAKVRMDTFWMKLARKLTPRTLLQERLDVFFGPEIEPPINELYRELKD
jgi:hypothetical protein